MFIFKDVYIIFKILSYFTKITKKNLLISIFKIVKKMNKKSKFFPIFFLFNIFGLISSIHFNFELFAGSSECFSESLPENMLLVGFVKTSQTLVGIRVFVNSHQLLFSKQENQLVKFSLTTSSTGAYQFCIDNINNEHADIEFELNTGIYAKDYSGMATKTNVKPIEIIIKKEEDLLNDVTKQKNFQISQKETAIGRVEDVSYNIMAYSIFVIVLMFVLSFFQMSYLRSFFKSKKLI